ncbi:hypothetical protein C3F09_02330 [candidate division GN15 bacterium]|uniref:Uncharacterized protein n=1 Tax=candidate division GN15 bacterium TaxID=2072418 RepID=A0A855X3M4_9BACT|nr:MAG: hypothetical protein C3F09_02330 [candidate division GN15 bacterium]
MQSSFKQEDADKIGKLLGAEKISFEKDHFRLKITNQEERRILTLEVYPETSLGRKRGMLVVVYTGNSHLQLHNCSGYVLSEELGEVTFVAEDTNRLSGLVVEKGASCSVYASIDRSLISSDFTQLGVEVMLSGVALSLAEEILGADEGKKGK